MPVPWRGLYAIVDPALCRGRDPEEVTSEILRGGCAVLQLRDKRPASDDALLELARRLRARCHDSGVPFVLNDRPDLAAAVGADGLHLGQEDLPLAQARRIFADRPIGLSTHDEAQATAAVAAGADLIGFGPVYETATKVDPDPVVGLERLARVCRSVPVPVVAIGGLDATRAAAARGAGAAMVAAISALCAADDPAVAAAELHRAAGGAG